MPYAYQVRNRRRAIRGAYWSGLVVLTLVPLLFARAHTRWWPLAATHPTPEDIRQVTVTLETVPGPAGSAYVFDQVGTPRVQTVRFDGDASAALCDGCGSWEWAGSLSSALAPDTQQDWLNRLNSEPPVAIQPLGTGRSIALPAWGPGAGAPVARGAARSAVSGGAAPNGGAGAGLSGASQAEDAERARRESILVFAPPVPVGPPDEGDRFSPPPVGFPFAPPEDPPARAPDTVLPGPFGDPVAAGPDPSSPSVSVGETPGPPAPDDGAVRTVPEPSSLLLLGLAASAAACHRYHRARRGAAD